MSSLSQRQQAVLDRHDQGLTQDQIANELGMSPGRVRSIISTFDGDPIHDEVRNRSTRSGSRRLLWHIRRAGGHR